MSQPSTTLDQASELMMAFAERTGLSSAQPARRYLWTDAFAVCNFIDLARASGEARYTELALALVEQVHHVLGRHRPDDVRSGWISGLGEQEGEAHPTRGGLRIGKPLPERDPSEPVDEEREWDRDGQYFHYLTKWMHALDQLARHTQRPQLNAWARELAEVAHDAFTYVGPGPRRMVWKMSIDLSHPLVSSMGHHDPLDGFITCVELRATQSVLPGVVEGPRLDPAIRDFAAMLQGQDWTTADPLGLGGLLSDAARVAQLMRRGVWKAGVLLEGLLSAAQHGLVSYARQHDFDQPASHRLAFRELGLAIGLAGLELIEQEDMPVEATSPSAAARELLAALKAQEGIADAIRSFWLAPEHQQARTWSEHRDINEVMLATSLVPGGFLVL